MLTHAKHSFHGGIHPAENKTQSLQLPLGRPTLPDHLILPLGQHIGQASRPLVNIGDTVLKGQAIAVSNGFFSSFLHAPTSGEIIDISQQAVPHPSGLNEACIILKPDNQDTWGERQSLLNWQTLPMTEVIEHLSVMGIVGMGGAGFPTQVKLSGGNKGTINQLIINAAECEPYITADDMLMREKSQELIKGIQVLQHLVSAEQTLIGIEDNKPTAIQYLETAIDTLQANIQIVVVPTKYPSGGEKQLIQLLTGKEVPSGKLPSDIGVMCQNVGTCVAVYDAIYQGQPLISRITTLTGDAMGQAQNVEVLLGTPVEHLMQYAELNSNNVERLVVGGPMMGFTITNTQVPVVKTTNCILAASSKELPTPEPEQACIRCGMCEQACPAGLLPQQLLWFSKSQEYDKAEHYNLFDCIECGACSYVCPSSIPLVQYYRHSKSTIRDTREATIKSDHAKLRFEARQARIEAEAAEKEAKRQATRAKVNANAAANKVANEKTTTDRPQELSSNAPSAEQAALKKLKVDLAIANTKLKKAQKNLTEAQESGDTENSQTLLIQVQEYQSSIQELQTEIDQKSVAMPAAVNPTTQTTQTSKPAISDEFKKAKVAAAIATTTLKRVQKQLADDPENAELLAKEKVQLDAVKKAETTFAELNTSSAIAPNTDNAKDVVKKTVISDDVKQAKVAFAVATTHLKKVQEKLAADPENTELQERVKARQAILNDAKKALEEQKSAQETTSQNTNKKATSVINDGLKKEKIDLAMAKAASKKIEKAIQKAEEFELPELTSLQTQYKEGLARIEQLEASLKNISEKGSQSPTNSSTNAADTSPLLTETKIAVVADPKKQLKIEHALAKAGLNKINRAIETRQKEGANEADLQAEGLLDKRRDSEAKLADVESKLEGDNVLTLKAEQEQQKERGSLTKPVPTAKPKENQIEIPSFDHLTAEENAIETKKQKIAAAMEKAKILKLQRRIESEPAAEKELRNKIEEARQKKNIAEHTLSKLHDSLSKIQENN